MRPGAIGRRAAFCLLAGLAGAAAAQEGVEAPSELMPATRPVQGDRLRVCLDRTSAGAALDRAVAQALGEALFLDVEIRPGLANFPLTGGGYLTELALLLNNECDVMMGMAGQAEPAYAEFAVQTRPYARVPFVLAVADDAVARLDDLPHDRMIGTALGSKAEMTYILWAGEQPEGRAWVRLPYADPALMIRRVRDGTLGGAVIWQPALAQVLARDADAQAGDPAVAIRAVALDPLPEVVVEVTAITGRRDAFLRAQLDEAIDALTADGTLAAIMDDLAITHR